MLRLLGVILVVSAVGKFRFVCFVLFGIVKLGIERWGQKHVREPGFESWSVVT